MIYKYNVELNEKIPVLVKETAYDFDADTSVRRPDLIADMRCTYCRLDKQAEERVMMVALDTAAHVLGVFEISHGTVHYSLISPREIILRALVCGASSFVLAHNHPSGSLEPSKDDCKISAAIKNAADIMDIKMLDFIIVSSNGYYSFATEKIF